MREKERGRGRRVCSRFSLFHLDAILAPPLIRDLIADTSLIGICLLPFSKIASSYIRMSRMDDGRGGKKGKPGGISMVGNWVKPRAVQPQLDPFYLFIPISRNEFWKEQRRATRTLETRANDKQDGYKTTNSRQLVIADGVSPDFPPTLLV